MPNKADNKPAKQSKPSKQGTTTTKPIKAPKARYTPSISSLPDLSAKDKKQLQAHLLASIPFKSHNGFIRYVTPRRKIYFWYRLKGYKHAQALKIAGLSRYTSKNRLDNSKANKALKIYWDVDTVNLDFILDRLIDLVQSGKNENSRVRALKLLSELKGYYATRSVIDINEHLQVDFSISGPTTCPHCGRSITDGSGTQPALQPVEPALIEAEYVAE